MSLADSIRRLFSPSSAEDSAEEAPDSVVTAGAPGLAGIEVTEAADDAVRATDPPSDPAP
jgi:hypothetical protein